MTFNEEIVAMRARIARAEAERDGWRRSGKQEKYLEAYSTVEALDLQLDALRQQGLRTDRSAAVEQVATPGSSERVLMGALGITFQDGVFRLGEHRYDRLVDAVHYARLRRVQGRRPAEA